MCRDQATALIEDILCEKIRGCSYRRGGASYSMSAMPHVVLLPLTWAFT
jgi:hypothetical protein